jgi:hypothetical protein
LKFIKIENEKKNKINKKWILDLPNQEEKQEQQISRKEWQDVSKMGTVSWFFCRRFHASRIEQVDCLQFQKEMKWKWEFDCVDKEHFFDQVREKQDELHSKTKYMIKVTEKFNQNTSKQSIIQTIYLSIHKILTLELFEQLKVEVFQHKTHKNEKNILTKWEVLITTNK